MAGLGCGSAQIVERAALVLLVALGLPEVLRRLLSELLTIRDELLGTSLLRLERLRLERLRLCLGLNALRAICALLDGLLVELLTLLEALRLTLLLALESLLGWERLAWLGRELVALRLTGERSGRLALERRLAGECTSLELLRVWLARELLGRELLAGERTGRLALELALRRDGLPGPLELTVVRKTLRPRLHRCLIGGAAAGVSLLAAERALRRDWISSLFGRFGSSVAELFWLGFLIFRRVEILVAILILRHFFLQACYLTPNFTDIAESAQRQITG